MTRAGHLAYPLASLLAEPVGSERAYPLAGVTVRLDDALELAEPIDGTLRVARTNRGVLVHVRARTALVSECARCLGPAATEISLAVDEEVLPSIDLATGQALDTSGEPEVLRLTDHHELDLEPVLREAIELAEPIAPVCRPDCPGLCPTCGARLADGHTPHEEPEIDPRLAILGGFRVDEAPETE